MTVSTIKSAGGDYSSLSAWEAAQAATLTAPAEAECYNFALDESTTGVAFSGITSSAVNFLRVYAANGEGHDGRSRDVSGTGFQVTSTNASGTFRVAVNHFRMEGIDLKATSTGAALAFNGPFSAGANDVRVEKSIVHDVRTGTSNLVSASTANLVLTWRNNIAYGSNRSLDCRNAATVELSNSTFWRHADQIGVLGDTELTTKNCYSGKASGSTEDWWTGGAAPAGNNNASSDSTASTDYTAGQTSVAGSAVFTSVTSGSEDFRLLAGTNALVDNGATLAAVTVDIIGTSRPQGASYDIGAFERTAGGVSVNVTAGVLLLAGATISVAAGKSASISAGALVLAGKIATAARGARADITAGVLLLAGMISSATVSGSSVTVTAGLLALVGTLASANAGASALIAAGVLLLAGRISSASDGSASVIVRLLNPMIKSVGRLLSR